MTPTCKDVCEAWVRRSDPTLSNTEIAAAAIAFWESDRHGGLFHVWEAQSILTAEGYWGERGEA